MVSVQMARLGYVHSPVRKPNIGLRHSLYQVENTSETKNT